MRAETGVAIPILRRLSPNGLGHDKQNLFDDLAKNV
jgi:hypothetical protein